MAAIYEAICDHRIEGFCTLCGSAAINKSPQNQKRRWAQPTCEHSAELRAFQTMKNGPEGPLTWCQPALATHNQAAPSTVSAPDFSALSLGAGIPGSVLAPMGSVMVVLHTVFVAADLSVELVHDLVNGGVQILM